jgi:hypothetical protein
MRRQELISWPLEMDLILTSLQMANSVRDGGIGRK